MVPATDSGQRLDESPHEMNRLSIRVRLTLVFALAMAAVLATIGAVLYQRLGSAITQQIDDRLQVRTSALSTLVTRADLQAALSEPGLRADDAFARIISPSGEVVATSPGFGIPPAATTPAGPVFTEFDVIEPDGDREPARALTTRLARPEGTYVVTTGESLTDRRDALRNLVAQMWLLGPIALLVASLLGYLVSRAALRPVERMRVQAELIGAEDLGGRLPLPDASDEVYRLGETLNAMLDRLDAGLRRERRFVADASHELRTPLALLQTELELSTRRSRSPEELQATIDSAKEEVERLVRLAEDMLVLASADEGHLPLRPTPIDAGELLDSVARRFATRAANENRTIDVDVSRGTTIQGDRLRLEQALGNLVDNALRDGQGTVRLRAVSANGSIELRVADDGKGFPEEFLPIAFERFTRADGVRTRGAAGLGLAIVRVIAAAHGGSASAVNRPGGGAEVTVSLPAPGPPVVGDGP